MADTFYIISTGFYLICKLVLPSENIVRKQKRMKILFGTVNLRAVKFKRHQIEEFALQIAAISEIKIFSIIPLNLEFLSAVIAMSVSYVVVLIQFELESIK